MNVFLKSLLKGVTRSGKRHIPRLAIVPNEGRTIVNHPLFEEVTVPGKKAKILQAFRNRISLKVWYYVNKTKEHPNGERVEHIVQVPAGDKILGYIEQNTENVFLVSKGKKKHSVYSVCQGNVYHMTDFSPDTKNQEIKKYLAG